MSGKAKKKRGRRKKLGKVKEFGPKSILVPRPDKGPLITLQLKLATWDFMDFTLPNIPIYTTLLEIRKKIIDRHGGAIMDVSIYNQGISPEHELTDLTKRLSDIFPDSLAFLLSHSVSEGSTASESKNEDKKEEETKENEGETKEKEKEEKTKEKEDEKEEKEKHVESVAETVTLYYEFETDPFPDPILCARIHLHPGAEDEEMKRMSRIDDYDFE